MLFGCGDRLAGVGLGSGCSVYLSSGLYFGCGSGADCILGLLASGSESFRGIQYLTSGCGCAVDSSSTVLGSSLGSDHRLPSPLLSTLASLLSGNPCSLSLGYLPVRGVHGSNSRSLHFVQPGGDSRQRSGQLVNRSPDVVQVLPQSLSVQPEGIAPRIQPERSQRLPLGARHLRARPPTIPARIPAETPRPSTLHPRRRQLRPALAVTASRDVLTHARERRG